MSDASAPFSFDSGIIPASTPQSATVGADQGGMAHFPPDPATTASAEALEQVRSKRGRKSNAEKEAELARKQAEFEKEYATLFEPRTWGMMVRAPADFMLHTSGRQLWNIPEKELEPLAITAAHTARNFLKTDPKWIALAMFSISLLQVYGTRAAVHMAEVRRERQEKMRGRAADQSKGTV